MRQKIARSSRNYEIIRTAEMAISYANQWKILRMQNLWCSSDHFRLAHMNMPMSHIVIEHRKHLLWYLME